LSTHITKLANGLTVATISMPNIQTSTIGAWVQTGSRNEPPHLNGISHFLEHMLFKGTQKRTSFEISSAIENVGGYMNAYTSKNVTAYHMKVLSEHTELAVDVLSDMFIHSQFPEDEMEKERGVILQEIAQCFDDPNILVYDYYDTVRFPNQSYGRPIIGTPKIVQTITQKDLFDYLQQRYIAQNTIIVCAGKVQHEKFVELVEKYFQDIPSGCVMSFEKSQYVGGFDSFQKDFEQITMTYGWSGNVYQDNPRRYSHLIASQAIGGGMSSPLLFEIREKHGLVYHVDCQADFEKDHSSFLIYAATTGENVAPFFDVSHRLIEKIIHQSHLTELDILRAKNQYKASLLMNLESPMQQAEKIVRNLQIFGKEITLEESISSLENVQYHHVQEAIQEMFSGKPTLQMIGPIQKKDIEHYYEKLFYISN
jgi:predicted Zn-dependent peptidase